MNIGGDIEYEAISFEDDAIDWAARNYRDEKNGFIYDIFKSNTQGTPQALTWAQQDLDGNVLSTFAPAEWFWQLRNTTPYFDVEKQVFVHQVLISDSEFINNQSTGSLVTCIVIFFINKDDFANSNYILINSQNSGGTQTAPPFGNPDVNTVWSYVGVNLDLEEVYVAYGGNTSRASWVVCSYDSSNVIDNLNMVSRSWGTLYRISNSEQGVTYNLQPPFKTFDYKNKICYQGTIQAPLKMDFNDGSYIFKYSLAPLNINSTNRMIRPYNGSHQTLEYINSPDEKRYLLDSNLDIISGSQIDWPFSGLIYIKPNRPDAVFTSNPLQEILIVQATQDKPLLSGAIVSDEQDDNSIPFTTNFPTDIPRTLYKIDRDDFIVNENDRITFIRDTARGNNCYKINNVESLLLFDDAKITGSVIRRAGSIERTMATGFPLKSTVFSANNLNSEFWVLSIVRQLAASSSRLGSTTDDINTALVTVGWFVDSYTINIGGVVSFDLAIDANPPGNYLEYKLTALRVVRGAKCGLYLTDHLGVKYKFASSNVFSPTQIFLDNLKLDRICTPFAQGHNFALKGFEIVETTGMTEGQQVAEINNRMNAMASGTGLTWNDLNNLDT